MRDVVTVVRCNNCGDEIAADEPEQAEWSLSFVKTGGATYQGRIDLCGDCAQSWLDDVQTVLAQALPYKRPRPVVTGSGAVQQPEPEPEDDLPYACSCRRRFSTQRGLSRHLTYSGHGSMDS